jgi:DNA-binding NarL/FixJ family response regulator
MAMRDDAGNHPPPNVTVPVDPAGRLLDLFTSLSALRENGQVLVHQIRGSIDEMRELRTRLRGQRPTPLHGTNGKQDRFGQLRRRYGLTRREIEVAVLLAQGCSNSDIANELTISAHTARHHTQRVLSKLEVHSRAAAGAKLRQ